MDRPDHLFYRSSVGRSNSVLTPVIHTTVRNVTVTAHLDARGLKCPMPIVRTAQRMRSMAAGEVLEVLATDPGSMADFAAWSRSTGNEVIESSHEGDVFRFVLLRK
jgi:tRNA 2-thiouridine synthesizing protein A